MKSILSSTSTSGEKRKAKRNIQFADEEARVVCEVESCFEFSNETREALYHSRNDYHFSRSSARVIAKESERYGHSRHLDGVYQTDFDSQVQDSLNLWCLHGSSRRGLERWANATHGQERKDDQYMYIHGVLRTQAEMKLTEYNEERLREVGHVLSRKSRLFAQMIGQADSHAAKWEFGMIDASRLPSSSPRQIVARKKNLGLSGKVNRLSDLASPSMASAAATASTGLRTGFAAPPASRRSSEKTISPKITIRTRPGRVPRMA